MAIAFGGSDMAGYDTGASGISKNTVSAWVRVPSATTGSCVGLARTSVGGRIGVQASGGNLKAYAQFGAGPRQALTTATFAPSSTVWHHICGTFSSDHVNCDIYLDGGNHVNATGVALTGGVPTMVTLGCWRNVTSATNSEFFTGDLAMVAVWSGEFDATEVARLAAGAHPLSINSGSLEFYMDCIQLDGNNDAVSINRGAPTMDVVPSLTAGTRTKVGDNPPVFRPHRRSQWFRKSPSTARQDRFFLAF